MLPQEKLKTLKLPGNAGSMRRRAQLVRRYSPLKLMSSPRLLFLVTCTSIVIALIWWQIISIPKQSAIERLIQEAIENVAKDVRYSEIYRKPSKLSENLKYILLWTNKNFSPLPIFKEGQRAFIDNNCSVINCYVTNDRKFFNGDLTKFNAIAFNGRNLRKSDLPEHRSPHQKYIYIITESADNNPVCNEIFNDFFNLTATYRLDSDIPFPYILIRDKQGTEIGPKLNMKWADDISDVNNSFVERLMNKTKAAAWFVSNCATRSGRNIFIQNLQKALNVYGHRIDVYGKCASQRCPNNVTDDCDAMLDKDYFFYMSLENSISEDYVTEKVFRTLNYNTVPIVYGGADYSRFIPPGSYINARKYYIPELAALMNRLMKSPRIYKQYFRWKNQQYTFTDYGNREFICKVCATLNNNEIMENSTAHKSFLEWWNPNYRKRCADKRKLKNYTFL